MGTFNMVVGTGMLAKAFSMFTKNEEYLIFASGVSNSLENSKTAFQREQDLILKKISENPDKTFIYFSTCSMFDPAARDSMYVRHKLAMEELIVNKAGKFRIFRITQIVGKTNNNTLINFLVNKIRNQELFEVWKNSTRNLIDIDDVFKIISYILDHDLFPNQVVHVANPFSLPVQEIIKIIEKIMAKPASYTLVDRGIPYEQIQLFQIQDVIDNLELKFEREFYYFHTIKKYYSSPDLLENLAVNTSLSKV
jgi:nucleoside-diphosphate-sugar epimerase